MSDELSNKSKEYCAIALQSIKQILKEFVATPSCFFSESDVKCRLSNIFFQHKEINIPKETMDKQLTYPLHTEVSYFDDNSKLLFHVDLSAVDVGFTDMQSQARRGRIRLAKGYCANVCYFAIELKLNKHYNKPKMLKDWTADMVKLASIKTRNPYLICFSILFDKKANKLSEKEFEEILNKYGQIRILYANTDGQIHLNF
jgi:hypothetical protein